MCGITGILNLDSKPVDLQELEKFTDSLAHRGPDGRGFFIDADSYIGLGHRRLAILDLSPKGHQPMCYADKRYWIVLNGEIYNFIEIRRELEIHGYSFISDSDTEVVLAAYDRWGKECVTRFNGMWAFAIWDRVEQTLFLSRDRFGVKPLYYYEDGKRFAFASEMKAFRHLNRFPVEFDRGVVSQAFKAASKVEEKEECLLKGVKRLRGGYALEISRNKEKKLFRWWNTLDNLETVSHSVKKNVERFRELFFDACNIRMRSDVALGTALSGGLDSSSVLCTIRSIRKDNPDGLRLSRDWQKAFIATYPGTVQDERVFAEEVIGFTGTQGNWIEIDPLHLQNEISKIIFHLEEIDAIHYGPWMVYKAMREKGVYVSLDGHGGDELMAGYSHHLNWAMRDTVWPVPHPFKLHNLRETFRDMVPSQFGQHSPTLKYLLKKRLFANKFDTFPALAHDKEKMGHFDCLSIGLYYDFHYSMLPTILRNFDRLSMAHGVEIRAPLMDWRLVCFVFSLSSQYKLSHGFTKWIFREAMKGILPESIRTRKLKLGFSNPFKEWSKSILKELIRDTVHSESFIHSPFWDGKKVSHDLEHAYSTEDWEAVCRIEKYLQATLLIEEFKKYE